LDNNVPLLLSITRLDHASVAESSTASPWLVRAHLTAKKPQSPAVLKAIIRLTDAAGNGNYRKLPANGDIFCATMKYFCQSLVYWNFV